jgi:hypothetical protein
MSTVPLACLLITLLTALPGQQAQRATAGANETATQFYLRWRSTALNARSIDEIKAFWTAETIDEFNMEPDAAKAETLTMVKRFYSAQSDVNVVKETATPTGATLALEGLDRDKKPIVSSVDIVKENGAWKITGAVERWQPKTNADPSLHLFSVPDPDPLDDVELLQLVDDVHAVHHLAEHRVLGVEVRLR